MSKVILIILVAVFGYLAYTASYMGEIKIAIGMGAVALLCLWAATAGKKKTAAPEPARSGRRR